MRLGMNRGRRGKEVVVLLCEKWHKAMVRFGCINERISVKVKFARVKLCVVVVYCMASVMIGV